jgi:pantetheine-phosphate adenylyltransferase
MKRIAVFPGSFDPLTIGHESIVRRSVSLFDEIIIAIGVNELKKSCFSLEDRMAMISKVFSNEPKVKITQYDGLTIDFCLRNDAGFILRGLRTSADFEFERAIGQVNRVLSSRIETIFLLSVPEHSHINSSVVREIIRYGGDASMFVPKSINLLDYRIQN